MISSHLIYLPKRLVSDHPMLHPRTVPPRQIAPARHRPRQVVRKAEMQPQRGDTWKRVHRRRRRSVSHSYTLARPLFFLFFCPPADRRTMGTTCLRRHQQTSIRDRDAVEPSPRSPPRHPRSAHRARKSLRHGPRASQRHYTPIQTARTLRDRLSTIALPFTHTLEYLTGRAECARTVYIRKGYAECSRTSGRT